jgi:hypothetical protein
VEVVVAPGPGCSVMTGVHANPGAIRNQARCDLYRMMNIEATVLSEPEFDEK